MPRVGSDLKRFLVEALSTKKYKNLFYLGKAEVNFRLLCPRKDSHEYISENIQIFKDWDIKKNHEFDYSYSRQRLESALKRSIFLVLVSSGKNSYDFRFSSCEEIALKRKQRRGIPVNKYIYDGESQPSSPESSNTESLPGYSSPSIKSPCNSAVEVRPLASTKKTFIDDSSDLENCFVEETEGTDLGFDFPLMGPSLCTTLHDGILSDLCNTDLINTKPNQTAPLIANLRATSVNYELGNIQDVNSSGMEVQKWKQISGKHIDVDTSGCEILEENINPDLEIAQSVVELVPGG